MKIYEKQRGVTLVELMIVIMIIALLAAVGYPAYQDSVRKTHRASAKSLLLELAAAQEKFFSRQGSYTDDFTDLGNYPNAGFVETERAFYRVTVAMDGTAPNYTGFTLTATAQGNQTADICDGYTINEAGQKGITTGDRNVCW